VEDHHGFADTTISDIQHYVKQQDNGALRKVQHYILFFFRSRFWILVIVLQHSLMLIV
jgi:hypothetical protein